MNKSALSIVCVCLFAIGVAAQTPSSTPPPTTPGNVSRVIYFDVLPGKNTEYTTHLRTNQVPILEEQKKQGLIINYGFFTKPTSEGPGDWDLGLIITYKNYADAIDFNAERGSKLDAISLKHYGTADARTKEREPPRQSRSKPRDCHSSFWHKKRASVSQSLNRVRRGA